MSIAESIRHADWQTEKHVPHIECPEDVKADEWTNVKISLGAAVAHPNTTEHHIRWIRAFFRPQGGDLVYHLGDFNFTAHGESTEGPDKGPVHTHHEVAFSFKTKRSGIVVALAYCNIHGLWESERPIRIT